MRRLLLLTSPLLLAGASLRWIKGEKNRFDKERDFFKDKPADDKGEVAFVQPGNDGDPALKQLERIVKDFNRAVENLPPFTLSLTRKDDRLVILGRQTNLQGTTARLIDLVMEGQMARMHRFDRFDRPPFFDKK